MQTPLGGNQSVGLDAKRFGGTQQVGLVLGEEIEHRAVRRRVANCLAQAVGRQAC